MLTAHAGPCVFTRQTASPYVRACVYPKCPAILPFRPKPALAQESSEPSKEAAQRAEGFRTDQQRTIWLALSRAEEGLTTEEICGITGWEGSTVRPRLVELDEEGRITRRTLNGLPFHPITNKAVATRKNSRGNNMTIWEATR